MACGPGQFALKFNVSNPEAVAWAETRAAQLVTNITADTRAAIRKAVAEALDNGVPPADTARLIRSSIGLTERHAGAVVKRYAKLRTQGKTAAQALKASEAYAKKLLRSRALTIARTETMRAANEGQAQLWKQAQQDGYMTGNEKKVWIAADPCPICAALDGEKVGVNESFSIGADPPAHPRCRCTIGLVN